MTAISSPRIDNSGTRARGKQGQIALPCVAGASLQLKEDGGLTAIRQPPLRASKGLPSFSKENKGLARRKAKERQLLSKAINGTTANRGRGGMGAEDGRGDAAAPELSAGAREEFAFKVARRDDILQVGFVR